MICKKVAFSKHKAHVALRRIQFRSKLMRAYICENCYRWHLTSNVANKYHKKLTAIIKGL